ncbi:MULTISPECIES: hypothetical protein [unclassified Herbaspirillum]|nr:MULTISPECIES: hypothetical protein [unclassified Herbaspirillum]MBB5393672.1 hypothetical protein [Herbaspirillum sp. SJZ102]
MATDSVDAVLRRCRYEHIKTRKKIVGETAVIRASAPPLAHHARITLYFL